MVSGCVNKMVVIVPQIMLQQLLCFHIQVSGNGIPATYSPCSYCLFCYFTSALLFKHLKPGMIRCQAYRDQCAVPDQSLTVMPSLRCRICMALPVIKSSLLEHTCCSTELCLLRCSLPLLECSCVLCRTPCLLSCLAAAAAPPAGSRMYVKCTGQLLWVADRSPVHQGLKP